MSWFRSKSQHKQTEEPAPLFRPIECVVGNVVYRTEGSTILAVRTGFGMVNEPFEWYLMKSPNGRYFEQYHHYYKGTLEHQDGIYPLTLEVAMRYYNNYEDKRVSFEQAFDVPLEDA